VVLAGSEKRLHAFDVPAAGAVAVVPPVPAAGAQLKVKWTAQAVAKMTSGRLVFDADGKTVAVAGGGLSWNMAAFDARDGKPARELTDIKGEQYQLLPLDKGRVAYRTRNEKAFVEWEPASGRTTVKPFTAPADTRGPPYLNVSPNGRYLLVGHERAGPGAKDHPQTPLKLYDQSIGLSVVMGDWHVGAAAFTADSSRVLVVDDTDRFRWFKLPSGKSDGEWTFGRTANGFNARLGGMSADGGVIAYFGTPPGREQSVHLLSGKDGSVIHSFPAKRYTSGGSVSEDGRFVTLVRNDGFGTGHTVEVLDTAGALLARVAIPPGETVAATSWKAKLVVMYDRGTQKLTAYDLSPVVSPAP
jgi:hypothetical protein